MATEYYNDFDFSDVINAHRKTNEMIEELRDLNQQIENSTFTFNKESDPDYIQTKKEYGDQMRRDMEDARGDYNANTGGLDNSWSQSMMRQEEREWDDRLEDYGEDLEKTRLSEYNKELSALKTKRNETLSNLKAFESAAKAYYQSVAAAKAQNSSARKASSYSVSSKSSSDLAKELAKKIAANEPGRKDQKK